jgi:hypothetical protein
VNTRTVAGIPAVALSLTLAAGSVAAAHHSASAAYEADRSITIKGLVAEFSWKNPHCHLYVEVTEGPFKGRRYTVELSSPEVLADTGWTKTLLRPGDNVALDVHPSRVGAAMGLCRNCPLTINGTAARLRGS